MAKIHIFNIDDDEIYNFMLSQLFREHKLPATLVSATDGKKGLKKLEKFHREGGRHFPDILLLDMEMPVMDGFAFLNVYEESYYSLYPQTQLYMVSSSIRPEDRNQAKAYECVSNFISKPLPLAALRTLIHQYQRLRGKPQ